MTLSLPNTADLIRGAEYFPTPAAFFGNFGNAWNAARCQVVKLETLQHYQELGNPAYEALVAGDMARAVDLLPIVRAEDNELYTSLQQREVELVRCRPLKFPLSDYMKWELAVYDINSQMGERIYCCNYDQLDIVFANSARHDFMVFDTRFAFVHNYSSAGRIEGGWQITKSERIQDLLLLFAYIRANCQPYKMYK